LVMKCVCSVVVKIVNTVESISMSGLAGLRSVTDAIERDM
jgi:hypothetical protein